MWGGNSLAISQYYILSVTVHFRQGVMLLVYWLWKSCNKMKDFIAFHLKVVEQDRFVASMGRAVRTILCHLIQKIHPQTSIILQRFKT